MEKDEKKSPDLEQDENQNQDENNQDENQDDSQPQDDSNSKEDEKDWEAEAKKWRAEYFKTKQKPHKADAKKSDDLDYGAKAFLTANGIKGTKEFDFVKDELKKSGEELENLLENDYFQSRLEKFRSLNKTTDAIPKGKGGSSVPTDSVEYWMTKPMEEVPHEMRIKVVNARLKKEEGKGKFYNQ